MSTKVYEILEAQVKEMLENGLIPWEKPYTNNALAYSGNTKKPYNFLNQMILRRGGQYFTFKQCQERGYKVKKGAKAEKLYMWGKAKGKTEKMQDENGEEFIHINGGYYFLTYVNVFNECDIEGLSKNDELTDEQKKTNRKSYKRCDKIVNEFCERESLKINTYSCTPHYTPSTHEISIPQKADFVSLDSYYLTLFHELGHASGKTLGREMKGLFESRKSYSKEELVAEICATIIGHEMKLKDDTKNSSAYCAGWLKALENNIKWLVWAASRAEIAANYIMTGEKPEYI